MLLGKINAENARAILAAKTVDKENKTRLYRCLTEYRGRPVHLQWIQGPESIEQASRQAVQQGAAQQMQIDINNFNFNPILPQTNRQDATRPSDLRLVSTKRRQIEGVSRGPLLLT